MYRPVLGILKMLDFLNYGFTNQLKNAVSRKLTDVHVQTTPPGAKAQAVPPTGTSIPAD